MIEDLEMAHSYLDYHGNHLHLRDEHIDWLMESILHESSNVVQMPSGLNRLLDWWKTKRNTFGPGCIELPLDECLKDPKSANVFTEILILLESKVREVGVASGGEQVAPSNPTYQEIGDEERIERHCEIIGRVAKLIQS